jgi:multisubunit Na+/H+ antiporter MnhB subunit
MKKLGIILIIVGLLFTIITGFGFFTKEKVADIGNIEISKSEPHSVNWSPYLGVGIIVIGGILLLAGPRK